MGMIEALIDNILPPLPISAPKSDPSQHVINKIVKIPVIR
jgi:hypothetical protein